MRDDDLMLKAECVLSMCPSGHDQLCLNGLSINFFAPLWGQDSRGCNAEAVAKIVR